MDLPSDSDESDVDFVPDEEITKSDVESEAEADKESEDQYEEALSKKRSKASVTRPMKKAKLSEDDVNESPKENKNASSPLDPQQAKKHEDDLWASFLTPTQSKNAEPSQDKSLKESKNTEEKKEKSGPDLDLKTTEEKEKPVNTTSSKNLTPGRSRVTAPVPITKKPAGGLASIISKIGKKDKMSTLERSKLDWMSFKKQEGIEEEIQTHNRGKDGYLERQDFLERTDHRQYEIEKSLRLNKRSSR